MNKIEITGEEALEQRGISEIRIKIEIAKTNVGHGMNEYEQFNFVYDYMIFAQRCGLIQKKSLDILWNELREATNAS